MATKRLETRRQIRVSKSLFPKKKRMHPFDWCLACRWGTLAVTLTAVYVFIELTSPVSMSGVTNMAALIITIGIILTLLLTVARARRLIKEFSY